MNNRLKNILEALVTSAIVLLILLTLAEDLLVLTGAVWNIRRIFVYTNLVFDLIFTLEFFVRSWNALERRRFPAYFWRENGWVDFLASIPLLIFISGPLFFTMISGSVFLGSGSLIGLLKVVKTVRMARVLRLLRLLKIFRRIRFAESAMVNRHTVRIVTTAAAALIISASAVGMVFTLTGSVGTEEAWYAEHAAAVESLKSDPVPDPDSAVAWGASHPSAMLLKNGEATLYSRYDNDVFGTEFGPSDYRYFESGPYSLWFDARPAGVSQSRINLTILIISLAVVVLLIVTYSPHFAMTVSDPVNVMMRGMTGKSYNLEVRVPERYSRDEVFLLARAYNDEYLPLKERSGHGEHGGALDISMDDISDLLKP
jgi:hypothetical protein